MQHKIPAARSLGQSLPQIPGTCLIALESMTCNVAHQSDDATEGVQAFLQKRDPVWTNS